MDKSFFQKMQEQCKKYVLDHPGAIIGGFAGLLFAILLFTFGLFKMLIRFLTERQLFWQRFVLYSRIETR